MQQDDRIFAVVGAGVIAAVASVAALMWIGSGITVDAPQRATVVVPRQPAPTAPMMPSSPVVEAALSSDGDDNLVRVAVARLSSHPGLASYVIHDRLLHRFVRAVDAVAGGYSPRDEVEFLRPTSGFMVRDDGGRLVIASGSFRRYSGFVDVIESLDTDGLVALYRQLGPRLESIYREVGWATEDFDARFRAAVDHLLEVAAPSGQIDVEQRTIVYAFAEDRFENLSSAQKQLLRMGPANVERIQAKLRDLGTALGWPEPVPAIVTAELEHAVKTELTDAPVIADASPMQTTDPVAEHAVAIVGP
jgi:hypothetical protein